MPVSKRRTTTGHTGLDNDMAIQITSMSATLSQLIPIPALSIATSTVLAIIDVVAEVKTNKTECARLAWRASRMLRQLARQLGGKWDTAPSALVSNIHDFEQTLAVFREFMATASDASWLKRLVGKSTIEDNMRDMNIRLDAAAQSFQVSSSQRCQMKQLLIYLLDCLSHSSRTRRWSGYSASIYALPEPVLSTSLAVVEKGGHTSASPEESVSVDVRSRADVEVNEFLDGIKGSKDKHGFNIYHQQDVRIERTHRRGAGWFSETADAQVKRSL
ncbi:unnamed protein product [Peniophora sp. CBMAI 1063]|nr:unnamed protein product [Peniophora sp. CBMAI 1063]